MKGKNVTLDFLNVVNKVGILTFVSEHNKKGSLGLTRFPASLADTDGTPVAPVDLNWTVAKPTKVFGVSAGHFIQR